MTGTDLVRIAGGGFAPADRTPSLALRIAAAPIRGAKALTQMLFSRSGGLVWRFMPRTRFNYSREVGDGTTSSVIMAPILWMARTFPEAPLQVLDPEGAPIEKHAMVQKIRRPNPYYSGIVMWMATILSWVVNGNAYWIKIRDGLGGVAELWWVPWWMITPETDDDTKLITRYVYTPGGRRVELDPSEVVHFRYGLDPEDPRLGLSPLGSVLREVFTDDEAANFSAALLKNLGIPGLLVSPKDSKTQPGPDDVKATKEYVNDEFTGDNRGQPLVMSGPTEVQQFGFSPEELSLQKLRRIPEERVTAVLGTPAVVVGLGAGLDRSTFANFAEAREAAYESNVIPSQRMFGEDLRHQLLPDFEDRPDDNEVAWDLSKVRVLQEDRQKESERVGQAYKDGVMQRAEARKVLRLEVDEGDNVYAVPVATILVPVGATPPGSPDPNAPALPAPPKRRAIKGKHTADQVAYMDAMDRDARVLEAVFTESLVVHFTSLGQLASDAFEAEVGDTLPETSAAHNGHLKDAQEERDKRLAAKIVAALALAEWIRGKLKPEFSIHYQRVIAQTVASFENVIGVATSIPDPVARKLIAEGGRRAGLVDITESAKQAIYQAISEGRAEGKNPIEIARRIRELVPAGRFTNAGPAYRAQVIARTETKYAQNISSIQAAEASDTAKGMVAFDGRLAGDTDYECESRDGQEFSFTEAENESANEHPNGTLSFAPVIVSSVREMEGAAA